MSKYKWIKHRRYSFRRAILDGKDLVPMPRRSGNIATWRRAGKTITMVAEFTRQAFTPDAVPVTYEGFINLTRENDE